MVKVWFYVLIYQTFKAFKDAMKYTLFEVTITRLEFLHRFLFLKIGSRSEQKCKNQLQLVIIFQEFKK